MFTYTTIQLQYDVSNCIDPYVGPGCLACQVVLQVTVENVKVKWIDL